MNRTRRLLMVLGLVAVASAGAYGQTRNAVVQDFDAFNYKEMYSAGMCADKTYIGSGYVASNFVMHVKRPLANNWYEAEVSSRIDPATHALQEPVETIRINAAHLCFVKPIQ